MIDTEGTTTQTVDELSNSTTDEAPWRNIGERARQELEAWARSRPRDRHRAERMTTPGGK